jgi:hypothetical protein
MMMKLMRAALAGVGLMFVASCASMVTGGPLVRPGEPVGAIDVYNGSSATVTSVLISDCSASTYGLNRMPEGTTIRPGQSYRFTVSTGCWDIMAGYGMSNGYAAARDRIQVQPNRVTPWGVR